MKRIFGLLLCVLVVALVACSEDNSLDLGTGLDEGTPQSYNDGVSGGLVTSQVSVIDGERRENTTVIGRNLE